MQFSPSLELYADNLSCVLIYIGTSLHADPKESLIQLSGQTETLLEEMATAVAHGDKASLEQIQKLSTAIALEIASVKDAVAGLPENTQLTASLNSLAAVPKSLAVIMKVSFLSFFWASKIPEHSRATRCCRIFQLLKECQCSELPSFCMVLLMFTLPGCIASAVVRKFPP